MATENHSPESAARTAGQFGTTHWSTVLAACDSASPGSREALEKLCRNYWYPLYGYVRRSGYRVEDAKDLTQAFFERFLEKHYLRGVDPAKGRFRSFLLKALEHFLVNEWERGQAAKRSGHATLVPPDPDKLEQQYNLGSAREESPDRHFDRLWAEALMDRALAALEDEYRAAGKAAVFNALVGYLSDRPPYGEYVTIGRQLGLSNHAVAVAVARLRERYAARIHAEIAPTVEDPAEVEAELRYLIGLVSR